MNIALTATKQKVEIPVIEYNLLKEVYSQFKKQIFLLKIIDAEENFKNGKVKKISIDKFIKNI